MEIKYTRAEYIDRKISHREYYGQFITDGICEMVGSAIGIYEIKHADAPHFHDIPLSTWDSLQYRITTACGKKLRAAGDYPTPAGCVCIAKEAALRIYEAENEKE